MLTWKVVLNHILLGIATLVTFSAYVFGIYLLTSFPVNAAEVSKPVAKTVIRLNLCKPVRNPVIVKRFKTSTKEVIIRYVPCVEA